MIGFGPSAISELRGSYAQSQREIAAWHHAVKEHGVATMRGHVLSQDDIERRWIIGRIMCHGEMRAPEFRDEFGCDFAESYAAELASLDREVADGLLTRDDDGSIHVTPLGRLLVRNIAMHFDAYLPEQLESGKRMFSKTV